MVKFYVFFIIFSAAYTTCLANNTLNECENHFYQKNWNEAVTACLTFLKKEKEATKESLFALSYIAEAYRLGSHKKQEKIYLEKIPSHPHYNNPLNYQYIWLRKKALEHIKRNQLDLAQKQLESAFDAAIEIAQIELISKAHNDFGVLYRKKGEYAQALKNYQKSLQIELKIGNGLFIGITLYNIADVLFLLEKPQEAVNYFEQALESLTKYTTDDNNEKKLVERTIAHVYENIVISYLQLNQPEKAKFYADKIINSFFKRESDKQKKGGLLALAKYYIDNEKLKIAYILLKQLAKTNFTKNTAYYLDIYWHLAHVEKSLSLDQQALQSATTGLNKAQEYGDWYFISKFNLLMSEIVENDNPQLALTHLKKYQLNREKYLQQKHDTQIDSVRFNIKSINIENQLIKEKYLNSEKEKKIAALLNWLLVATFILFVMINFLLLYYFRKKREKNNLIESINHHKQQMFLLQTRKESEEKINKKTKQKTLNSVLVKTMIQAIDIWHRHSGKNKIDLAEKSKAWTISNDNGNLRTRSMDKYLSIDKVPKNPRWRQVIRTCHFILSNEDLDESDRKLLNQQIKSILDILEM